MNVMRIHGLAAIALAISALASCAQTGAPQHGHDPSMHAAHAQGGAMPGAAAGAGAPHAQDPRVPVRFPAPMREHTLSNMRDHLLALQEIQAALAQQQFDRAAEVAERRLGMSSLALHGAHEVAPFMPRGMQDAGTAMHRAASRLAVSARDSSAIGDLRPAIAGLAELTATCVACHAAYRLE